MVARKLYNAIVEERPDLDARDGAEAAPAADLPSVIRKYFTDIAGLPQGREVKIEPINSRVGRRCFSICSSNKEIYDVCDDDGGPGIWDGLASKVAVENALDRLGAEAMGIHPRLRWYWRVHPWLLDDSKKPDWNPPRAAKRL